MLIPPAFVDSLASSSFAFRAAVVCRWTANCLAFFCVLALSTTARAQPSRAASEESAPANAVAEQRLERMQQAVQGVELAAGDRMEELRLQAEPVQRWNNPVGAGIPDAAVFLWTLGPRPGVVAQVFQIRDGPWLMEAQSLLTVPITGSDQGKTFWASKEAGVEWRDPPRAKTPAKAEALRLVQMRAIGRQFSATSKSDTDSPNRLRMLTTPLFRYASPDDGVLDGALFSFAQGTDPEVLLLIEAQRSAKETIWRIAFTRMSTFACEVTLDGEVFWSAPLYVRSPSDVFAVHRFAE